VWLQFAFLNQEISNPALLTCPSDTSREVASNWRNDTNRGLAHVNFQNRSVSYILNLDCGLSDAEGGLNYQGSQNQILISERHMSYSAQNSSCSARVGNANEVKVRGVQNTGSPANERWRDNPSIHPQFGNIALLDGSTHKADNKVLNDHLDLSDDGGAIHFLYP
jgi:hypothetical protein